MDDERLVKLAENIRREANYPPIIVRPHPDEQGCYQLLDGHQRVEALGRLGYKTARCYIWPCDDAAALTLLATLNRLEGQDDPRKRAELLAQLATLSSPDELAQLLPESGADVRRSLEFLDLDFDELLAEFAKRADGGPAAPVALTFAVPRNDVEIIEAAIERAAAPLSGPNRRGRALAEICRQYKEVPDA